MLHVLLFLRSRWLYQNSGVTDCLADDNFLRVLPEWGVDEFMVSQLRVLTRSRPPSHAPHHANFLPQPFRFRSRSTAVHSAQLFVGNSRTYQGKELQVNKPPKLAVVDLTREPHLFKNTDTSNTALKSALGDVFDALHPQGTMAVACPRPWFGSGAILAGT